MLASMSLEAWFLAGLLIVMLSALASSRIAVDLVMLGSLTLLVVTGILNPQDAISGYSNQGLITVGLLYIMAAGLKETGAINILTARLLGRPKTVREAQLRLVLPVAFLSAFANNTPIVASFLPVIDATAKRCKIPASKLYMPLSFAAILGGLCTLIGTSTTLIVAGLILDQNDLLGADVLAEFGMFTIGLVGIPIAIVGAVYILLFGRRLLPDEPDDATPEENARQYMTAMRVEPDAPIIGKTIEQAGLRSLPGLYLSRIDRLETTVIAVRPDEIIGPRDVLVFVGVLDSVMDLQKIRGLTPVTSDSEHTEYRPSLRTVEAVVSNTSPLIGQTIREAGVRSTYGAVVVAVHRQGHRLKGKVGDIKLLPGDTLLMEAGPGFAQRHRASNDFHLVSELDGWATHRHERAWVAIVILVGVVIALSSGFIAPVTAAMLAATLTILLRCCTGPQAREAVDWSVLLVIGAAFGIGHAMQSTGLAGTIADAIIGLAGNYGPVAILSSIYLVTVLFTMFITNNAAAVLMFPIAYATASAAGMEFTPIAVCIAVAASAEFSTPIGYQTNLIVMGPGGYKWFDYTRFGGPLTIIAGIVCVALASTVYGPLTTDDPLPPPAAEAVTSPESAGQIAPDPDTLTP